MIKRRDKGGQFYILAAVIIITGIVSFVSINNYVKSDSNNQIINIADELGIESGEVLDYSIYTGKEGDELDELMEKFTRNYSEYIRDETNLYFVYGDNTKVSVASYSNTPVGKIGVGMSSSPIPELEIKKRVYGREIEIPEEGIIEISIEGIDQQFSLKPGQNFYFIISQSKGNDKHVITNKDTKKNDEE